MCCCVYKLTVSQFEMTFWSNPKCEIKRKYKNTMILLYFLLYSEVINLLHNLSSRQKEKNNLRNWEIYREAKRSQAKLHLLDKFTHRKSLSGFNGQTAHEQHRLWWVLKSGFLFRELDPSCKRLGTSIIYIIVHLSYHSQYKKWKGIIKIWLLPWEQALQSIASRFLWFLRYIHETKTWVLSLEPFLPLGWPSSQIPVTTTLRWKPSSKLIWLQVVTSSTHYIDFVANEHLNAVMVSRVELDLFGPNIC